MTQLCFLKWKLSDSITAGTEAVFLTQSSLKSKSGGLTVVEIYFLSQTLDELKLFAGDKEQSFMLCRAFVVF